MTELLDKATAVREGNDRFRKSMGFVGNGKIVATQGAQRYLGLVMPYVAAYTDFTPENDPYGEHDFGVVECMGQSFYWKIDYYDENYEYGADPLEEETVNRVLTVMHSSEY